MVISTSSEISTTYLNDTNKFNVLNRSPRALQQSIRPNFESFKILILSSYQNPIQTDVDLLRKD
jgi:hypothetical protein